MCVMLLRTLRQTRVKTQKSCFFYSNDNFDIRHANDLIARVSRKRSKCLALELLKFFTIQILLQKNYKKGLSSFSMCKRIYNGNVSDNLDGSNLESAFVACQSQHGPKEKKKSSIIHSVKVQVKQLWVA